jgi:hypothetical protein
LQTTKFESFNITYQFVNGNNDGSLLANKEFQICYCVTDIDIIKTKMKKIIGCFINPNDLYLDKSNIDRHFYFFQCYLKLNEMFDVNDMLLSTVYSKNYSNHITKKNLKENTDVTIRKIITKCETILKEKILIS